MLLAGGTRLVELPRMYYGIVKKDVVSKVKQTCDTYIPGPSPDMANAVSMSVFTNNIYYVNFPIFIAGNSNKSTAGLGAKGAHVGKIEDVAFLPKDCAQKWSELIPKFWSGPTIWAESAIKAMEACDKKKINDFNYLNLYANCMVFNSSWNHLTYSSINKYISENKRNPIVVYTAIYYYIAILWVERFKILSRNILKILKFKLTINNNSMAIENVYCATEVLNEILSRKQNPFRV
jgi:hypothetical protein